MTSVLSGTADNSERVCKFSDVRISLIKLYNQYPKYTKIYCDSFIYTLCLKDVYVYERSYETHLEWEGYT
jgi:hypothetical protein